MALHTALMYQTKLRINNSQWYSEAINLTIIDPDTSLSVTACESEWNGETYAESRGLYRCLFQIFPALQKDIIMEVITTCLT